MNAHARLNRRRTSTLLLVAVVLVGCDDGPMAPQAPPLEAPLPGSMAPLSAATSAQDAAGDRYREIDTRRSDLPGAAFGGLATLVGVRSDPPHTVARIEVNRSTRGWLVDLHEGRTQFDPHGDLVRFDQVLEALEAGVRLIIMGSGPIQDDGVIAAARATVLIPDHDGGDGSSWVDKKCTR